MIQPIWKDAWISLGTGDSATFDLVVDGNIIYTGKAQRKPDSEQIRIRINDIVADYLGNELPARGEGVFTETPYLCQVSVQVNGTEVDNITFGNDWSYDYGHDIETDGLACPINGKVSALAPVVVSVLRAEVVKMVAHFTDGTSAFQMISLQQMADFNADFNIDFSKENLRENGTGAVAFDLGIFSKEIASVEIDGQTFEVSPCGDFVLYYVNAFGGWDTFLLDKLVKRRDTLTRHERGRLYDNSDSSDRGRDNYLNEIVRQLELHTGWLSDEQSLKMHHLLNSTCVYLWDIARQLMFPLVLTDTTTEHKTYRGEGRTLINYTINAEIAQDFIRR